MFICHRNFQISWELEEFISISWDGRENSFSCQFISSDRPNICLTVSCTVLLKCHMKSYDALKGRILVQLCYRFFRLDVPCLFQHLISSNTSCILFLYRLNTFPSFKVSLASNRDTLKRLKKNVNTT